MLIVGVTLEQRTRFGALVAARRSELGRLSRDDVHAAGGPSDTTLARLENPDSQMPPPRKATFPKLDLGLQWVPGSAARAWAGGDPVGLEQAELANTESAPAEGPEGNPLTFRQVQVDVDLIQRLFAANDTCLQFFASPELPESVRDSAGRAKQELGVAVAGLFAAYATDVLERAGGPGRDLPGMIDVAFASALTAPPAATGTEREDQLYRRWLAHRAADLDPDLPEKFTARWRAKMSQIRLAEGNSH